MPDFAALTQTVMAPPRKRPVTGLRPSVWRSLINLDFARPIAGVLLGVAFVLSRLPWVGMGYGEDPDAWRVAMSAASTRRWMPAPKQPAKWANWSVRTSWPGPTMI